MTQTAETTFLVALRSSGLLTAAQLATVGDLPGAPARAADSLVAKGLLTRFQAERLLAGRADGFQLGPYVILEQVGKGSMGRVYKARHQAMNRAVAIKVLAPELTSTAAAKEAFQREVRAAAKLNHPNIVTAYDANEVGERFYLVLEFVDGPSLDAVVKARGPLPVAEACGYVRQIAAGLQHAHETGMAHRHLKPSNVMVTRAGKNHAGGEVKIADFGVARLGPGASPDFVAPEQAHDPRAAADRADLYSLGCVFYFLLTGRAPGRAGAPVRTDLVRPDVPPPVAWVVHTLLAAHPAARFPTAGAVAAQLGAVGFEDGAVSFEMPPVLPGAYSFSGSSGHPSPVAETSPWAQLTDDATLPPDVEITPVATRVPRRMRSRPRTPWGVIGAVTAVAVVLLAVVVRAMAK